MFKKDEITNNKNTKKFIIFMLIFIISFSTLIPVLASPIEDSIIGIFTGEEVWVAEDFEYDDTTLTGFSESG
ncbi:MAG: hypothetical protein GX273_10465, partial [Bacteroidales bacterium]|nr:hypothetical protein [Bacteroidales bacterium]